MNRIDSEKVNLGSSYILTTSDEQMKAQEIVNAKTVAGDIITQARGQAQELVAETQKKAQKHLDDAIAQANSQVESIREEARKSGFEQGYQEGMAKIKYDLIDQINNLDRFVLSEFDIKKRIIKSAHNDIINLVVTIADKVCRKKLELDSEVLYNITKAAINELNDKESVNIIVNPIMAQRIYDISEGLKQDILSLKSIKIIEDSNVSADGTIVESISSRVDSRVSSQIDEITQKLLTGLQTLSEDKLVAEVTPQDEQHD